MAVVRGVVPMQPLRLIDAAEQMVCGDVIFQVEGVEQQRLPGFLTSHHRVNFRMIDGASLNRHQMTDLTGFFFNGIHGKRALAVACAKKTPGNAGRQGCIGCAVSASLL